ncbi:hypothetical protein EV1_018231 [Malus domestica]
MLFHSVKLVMLLQNENPNFVLVLLFVGRNLEATMTSYSTNITASAFAHTECRNLLLPDAKPDHLHQKTHLGNHVDMLELNAHLKQLVKTGNVGDARLLERYDFMDQYDFRLRWSYGEVIHGYSMKSGLVYSVFVGNALLDMYMKIGKIEKGCRIFDEMPIRNVVSWTTIITGLVRAGYNVEGLEYFSEMWRSKVQYDAYVFAISLKACADLGALKYGRAIHTQTMKNGFNESSFVANSLRQSVTMEYIFLLKTKNILTSCNIHN